MTKRFVIFSILSVLAIALFAQAPNDKTLISVQSRTIVSAGDEVPFWMQMNELGVIDNGDSFQQLFLLNFQRRPTVIQDRVQLSYGLNMMARLSGHAAFRPTEYWSRLHYNKWFIHLGAKAEPVFGDGLSLTNGNLHLSNNARPMPRMGFGVSHLKFSEDGILSRFYADFEFNEYFLLDDRYVEDANLHHKRLDLSYRTATVNPWIFSAGIDHWVFWGGDSPNYGKMPGFEDYLRYVFGKSGSSNSISEEQENVAGNQLGSCNLNVAHENEAFLLKMYWQHLWEDRSGMQFENAPDGLWGIYLKRTKEKSKLQAILMEYINTRDQSGRYHHRPNPDNPEEIIGEGRDNYFNHFVYRSGFVSYNRMIGIPLFIPMQDESGISRGFGNTRLWALHNGLNGWLTNNLSWKTLLTFSRHYGNYGQEFESPKDFLSLAVNFNYLFPEKPLTARFKLAYDHGSILQSSWGVEIGISYQLK